jgi:hypothetical protein
MMTQRFHTTETIHKLYCFTAHMLAFSSLVQPSSREKTVEKEREANLVVDKYAATLEQASEDVDYWYGVLGEISRFQRYAEKTREWTCFHVWSALYQEVVDLSNDLCPNPSFFDALSVTTSDGQVQEFPDKYMCWVDFCKIRQLWTDKVYTLEEFKEKGDFCTDWYKMNREGESYTGFWATDPDNAWQLTFEDNMVGLMELPYPHDIVLYAADIGCKTRRECVRFCEKICAWIKMKMELVPV